MMKVTRSAVSSSFPLARAGGGAYNLALSNLPTQVTRAYTIANMRRRTLLVVIGLTAFFAGASLDYHLRKPVLLDCACMGLKCRLVFIADHPQVALSHPLETLELLRTPRGYY